MTTIDAQLFAKMFLQGAKNLEAKKEWINELNVFPVPDGDTGTNMTMTIMSAAKDVASLMSTNDVDMASLCKAISSGSLRGARGNSGVILSQLLRGFCKYISEYDILTIEVLANASTKAIETAYKAVMKPKEGTILTVAREMSEKAVELYNAGADDVDKFIEAIIEKGNESLKNTPELLPVLKQAGVVDSGGQGLMEVMQGAFDCYRGKDIDLSTIAAAPQETVKAASGKPSLEYQQEADIKFGYCTEFIIQLDKVFNVKQEMDFKDFLESIGDSIVCVADDELVKVHVHTNDPGLAIQRALKYGPLNNIKIDNMRIEHQEKLFKQSQEEANNQVEEEPVMEHKEVGFISVSVGDGLNEIFKSLGVDYIIEGGQTMNPSTDDILKAIDKVNADTIYVLPNNKNIIMAAEQAKSLCDTKNIVVVPTKTVPQGITAIINYMPDISADDNIAAMSCEINNVKTGQVTFAVRDTSIDGKEIHKDDFMGIGDSGILSVGKDQLQTAFDMICEMMKDECEILCVYYGKDATEEEASKLEEMINDKFPDCEVDLQYGGQPIYSYIISAE